MASLDHVEEKEVAVVPEAGLSDAAQVGGASVRAPLTSPSVAITSPAVTHGPDDAHPGTANGGIVTALNQPEPPCANARLLQSMNGSCSSASALVGGNPLSSSSTQHRSPVGQPAPLTPTSAVGSPNASTRLAPTNANAPAIRPSSSALSRSSPWIRPLVNAPNAAPNVVAATSEPTKISSPIAAPIAAVTRPVKIRPMMSSQPWLVSTCRDECE